MFTFLHHYVLPFLFSYAIYYFMWFTFIISLILFLPCLREPNVAGLCGIYAISTYYVLTNYVHVSTWPKFNDFENFYKIACMDMVGAMFLWLLLAVVIPIACLRLNFILFFVYLYCFFFGI